MPFYRRRRDTSSLSLRKRLRWNKHTIVAVYIRSDAKVGADSLHNLWNPASRIYWGSQLSIINYTDTVLSLAYLQGHIGSSAIHDSNPRAFINHGEWSKLALDSQGESDIPEQAPVCTSILDAYLSPNSNGFVSRLYWGVREKEPNTYEIIEHWLFRHGTSMERAQNDSN